MLGYWSVMRKPIRAVQSKSFKNSKQYLWWFMGPLVSMLWLTFICQDFKRVIYSQKVQGYFSRTQLD